MITGSGAGSGQIN